MLYGLFGGWKLCKHILRIFLNKSVARNMLLFILGRHQRIELNYMVARIFKFKTYCQITSQSEFCHWTLPLACLADSSWVEDQYHAI